MDFLQRVIIGYEVKWSAKTLLAIYASGVKSLLPFFERSEEYNSTWRNWRCLMWNPRCEEWSIFFLELVHSIFPPLSLCELFTFYEGWRDAIFWLLQGEAFFMFKKHTKCIVTPGGQYLKMRVHADCGIWCKNPEKMDEGEADLEESLPAYPQSPRRRNSMCFFWLRDDLPSIKMAL